MVLESIESVRDAMRSPWHLMVFGAVISLICLSISYLVFPENAGLLTVFLITIATSPFMLNLMRYEEFREERQMRAVKGLFNKINPLAALWRQGRTFLIYSAF